jgi:hypothetical protein
MEQQKQENKVTVVAVTTSELTTSKGWREMLPIGSENYKDLVNARNWVQLMPQISPKNAVEAANLNVPTLRQVSLAKGEDKAATLVEIALLNIRALLNIGGNLRDEQMNAIAVEIVNDFPLLKISEIVFAIKQGIKGGYGKIYDRVDLAVISDWLRQYGAQKEDNRNPYTLNERAMPAEIAKNVAEVKSKIAEIYQKVQARHVKTNFENLAAFCEYRNSERGENWDYPSMKATAWSIWQNNRIERYLEAEYTRAEYIKYRRARLLVWINNNPTCTKAQVFEKIKE